MWYPTTPALGSLNVMTIPGAATVKFHSSSEPVIPTFSCSGGPGTDSTHIQVWQILWSLVQSDDISVYAMTCNPLWCVIKLYQISVVKSVKAKRHLWVESFCLLSCSQLTSTSSLPITLWALMTQLTDLAHLSSKTTSRCRGASSSRGRRSTMTSTWKALHRRRERRRILDG